MQATQKTQSVVASFLRRFVQLLVTSGKMHFATMSGYRNAEGVDDTSQLAEDLRNAGFTVLTGFGCYKGTRENSLLILAPSWDGVFTGDDVNLLNEYAARYHQESYMLYRGDETGASFEYTGESQFRREYLPKVDGHNVIFSGDSALAEDFYSEFAGFPFSFLVELQ